LDQVRAQGHDIHLHIVGAANEQGLYWGYYQEILTLINKHAKWISFEENISRQDLIRLITTHRYGIHSMVGEHFGVAVGELMCGGAIVFVPNDGGQVEIVGNEPRLLYTSRDDAVKKITRVMGDTGTQAELRAQLAARAESFGVEHFMRELRAVVTQFLTPETTDHGETA
jgi:glycosyltransferase involved in cell wall biosynthesis